MSVEGARHFYPRPPNSCRRFGKWTILNSNLRARTRNTGGQRRWGVGRFRQNHWNIQQVVYQRDSLQNHVSWVLHDGTSNQSLCHPLIQGGPDGGRKGEGDERPAKWHRVCYVVEEEKEGSMVTDSHLVRCSTSSVSSHVVHTSTCGGGGRVNWGV